MSPFSVGNYVVTSWRNGGSVCGRWASNPFYVRPSLYIKSQISITRGTGEKNNPYQMSLEN